MLIIQTIILSTNLTKSLFLLFLFQLFQTNKTKRYYSPKKEILQLLDNGGQRCYNPNSRIDYPKNNLLIHTIFSILQIIRVNPQVNKIIHSIQIKLDIFMDQKQSNLIFQSLKNLTCPHHRILTKEHKIITNSFIQSSSHNHSNITITNTQQYPMENK